VLVPVGGGGLASGVATAVKRCARTCSVIGVEPELAADAVESLAPVEVVVWPTEQTVRTPPTGLRTNLSELHAGAPARYLDGIVTVSEAEILSTVGSLARTAGWWPSPAGRSPRPRGCTTGRCAEVRVDEPGRGRGQRRQPRPRAASLGTAQGP
jgi:threonine dehydratase